MKTETLWLLLYTLGAFIAGSIPFGWIFARLRGIDLTKVGSGNIGATNAARALGRPMGILVLVLDGGKAFLPVYWALHQSSAFTDFGIPGAAPALIGFAAILGHVFSPWLSFRGGKGVASSLGVFLALAPISAVFATVVWLLLYLLFRIASVGSLIAAATLVIAMIMRHEPLGSLIVVIATFVLVLVRHVDNIKRLLAGSETKL